MNQGFGFIKNTKPTQGFVLKHFCTNQNQNQSSVDRMPHNESAAYARLTGIGKYTSRGDIIHFFEGKLSPDDIKVQYTLEYNPLAMIIHFPSPSALDSAIRFVARKPSFRLDRVDPRIWNIPSYNQHVVLLQGLPRNAQAEDIARFLCGSEFNSSFQLFLRGPNRMALVQFPSQIQAMNAVLAKNRSFCLNNQVLMRLLH